MSNAQRRHRDPKRFHGLLLLFLLALGAFILFGVAVSEAQEGSGEIETTERELQALREQIAEHRARAAELEKTEQGQVARLDALEKEAGSTAQLIRGLSRRQKDLEAEVATLQAEIAGYESGLDGVRARLAAQLRDMYIRGRESRLGYLASSTDLNQLAARVKLMTHVAKLEEELIHDVQSVQLELRDRRVSLDETLAEVYRNQSEAQERRTELGALRAARSETLDRIRAERVSFESSAVELERNAAAMEQLLADLEQRRLQSQSVVPSTDFATRQGSLSWPLRGRVVQGFGRSVHPEFKTVVMNKGINIAAATGTPIRVVAAGVVEYVNWLPGYGKCIIVNHGDGYYTLYAHASEIFPGAGEGVAEGQVIAEAGDTGSLNGSQLYFEIRKGKEPIDPSQWLGR